MVYFIQYITVVICYPGNDKAVKFYKLLEEKYLLIHFCYNNA